MSFPLTVSASSLALLLAQSTVLLLAAAVATRFMRASSAAVRHLVWATTLGLLLVLPFARALTPQVDVPVLPAVAVDAAGDASAAAAWSQPASVIEETPLHVSPSPAVAVSQVEPVALAAVEPGAAEQAMPKPAQVGEATPAAQSTTLLRARLAELPWTLILVGTWLFVALVLILRVALSHLQLRALRRRAWLESDPRWTAALHDATRALKITRPITLLATEHTAIPMTWGTLAPVVLVPAESGEWDDARRRAVLVHELAHVARRDALMHEMGRIAAALYWPNPLVWVALRAMRAERERACDDLVLRSGLRASSYAADLLDIARGLSIRPVAVAALAMARRSDLEGRLLSILDPRAKRSVPGRVARGIVAAMALLLVIPLSALRPSAAPLAAAVQPAALDVYGDIPDLVVRSSPSRVAQQAAVRDEVPQTEPMLPLAFQAAPLAMPALSTALPSVPAAMKTTGATAETIAGMRPRAALPADERETLIAVAVAARRMTSDYEKTELLLEIAANYMSDDQLRAAYLATAATVKSNYERHRVLLGLLAKDSLLARGSVEFLTLTGALTSNHEKSVVLNRFTAAHGLTSDAERTAFFAAASTLGGHELATMLIAITKKPWFDAKVAVPLIATSTKVSSSYTRADVLVAVARTGILTDETVRKAFLTAAETLTTDSDYGRVMAAAAGRRRG